MNDPQSAEERLAALVHINRFYETLSLINQAIVGASTREQLFQRSCQVLVDHCGFPMAWVGWLDTPGGQLQPVASFGDESGWNKNFERVKGYSAAEIATTHPPDFNVGEENEILAARIGDDFSLGESRVEAGFVSRDGRGTPYQFTSVLTIR